MAKKNGREVCTGLTKFVREELARIAEPTKAPAMAAYMKTSQPFYGVTRPKQYAAIEYARQHPRFIVPQSMKLYERLIRQGAWWDLVDDVAEYLVGSATLAYCSQVRSILERWIDDPDLWIRRTAIIAQVQHKGATDGAQLFDYGLRRSGESEFFIRKAIGWALRAYSKSNPEAVRDFLLENRGTLAPLSLREGAKHLVRLGKLPAGFP